jgi:uncharacterized protein (DUF342 family)
MYCELYAGGKVIASGQRGSIAGGSCTAVKGLRAKQLGNPLLASTSIQIGVTREHLLQLKATSDSIEETEQELKILRNAYGEMIIKYPPEERNTMDVFLKVEKAIFSKEKELQDLKISRRRRERDIVEMRKAAAEVSDAAYEGVVLEINGEVTKCRKN